MGYFEALLKFNYAYTFDLMVETFSLTDLLFYAIAVYAGYRYSFRRLSLEEENLFDDVLKNGIVISCINSWTCEIYVVNSDGTGQYKLTNFPGDKTSPVWRPQPSQISK